MRLEYFQMIDRVTRLDVAARVVEADCMVPKQSPIFEGHFPGHPILPGVLMIETMAQACGWLAMAMLRFERMAFLAQVREAKMRSFVEPGAVLRAEGRIEHEGSGYTVAKAKLYASEMLAAEAELRFRVGPFPNAAQRAALLQAARRVGVPDDLLPEPA